MKPLVSIVVEAYNEDYNALAPPADTLAALLKQDFPLDQAELILIGSSHQIEHWKKLYPVWPSFGQVKTLPVDPENSHYWRLKNQGAQAAEGDILALIDCDALPEVHWLSSGVKALQDGADASVGPSQYRTGGLSSRSPWMLAAALPSWSFALARTSSRHQLQADALMAHNLVIRRQLLLEHPFRVVQRSFASSLLYFELVRSGVRFSYQPEQSVAHGVNFWWWLSRMHFRRGWETYAGRELDPDWPRVRLLQKLKLIEPIVLRAALVGRDARHWFRFSRVLGVGPGKAVLLFPLAVTASVLARSAEMVGMYAALFAPKASEHQARF
jgi:hypothetical protein